MTYAHEISSDDGHGKLWNLVAKTYPSATKPVRKGGRTFTAIDAYSQIKRATEVFGSVGSGWGWDVKQIQYFGECPHDLLVVTIDLWYWEPGQDILVDKAPSSFSSVGCVQLNMQPKGKEYTKTDDDAVKKALTDAITKGLSYLGFNADVFFGAFDDNKYVQMMRDEEAEKARPTAASGAGTPASSDPDDKPDGGVLGTAERKPRPLVEMASPITGEMFAMPWASELVGGEGKYSEKTWGWMLCGGVDGGRHKYLRWMYENWHNDKILKRVAWVLEKFYDDTDAEDGLLKVPF